MNNPQLNKHGELQHLLTTEGLPINIVRDILDRAATFLDAGDGKEIRKIPLLQGKSVFNVFFENSTRTRTTFEIAAKKLSADVVNLNIGSSSTSKGRPCWILWIICAPCTPTCSWCATRKAVPRISSRGTSHRRYM